MCANSEYMLPECWAAVPPPLTAPMPVAPIAVLITSGTLTCPPSM
jgi:hypothetical protein